MNQMKYYVDADNNYLLGTDGEPPEGGIEVPFAPDDARQKWDPAAQAWGQIPASAYRLYKSNLIRRLTEQEAVVLTAVLDGAPVKSRMLWDASEWLDSSDPLFADLEAAIGDALGIERAGEILAPEA